MEKPLFTAKEYMKHLKERGDYPGKDIPESVILCYIGDLIDHIKENYELEDIDFKDDFYLIKETDGRVGVIGNFGIGAPPTAIIVEELAELGVKNFIGVGYAGTLDEDLDVGDVVLCERALRDEGTSYHYLEPSKYAKPSDKLTEEIERFLKRKGIDYTKGTTWTIDAPYRETEKEIERYKEEGVKTVDMEASALFAVGRCREIEVASIFLR
jgi:uridine phosphorylase